MATSWLFSRTGADKLATINRRLKTQTVLSTEQELGRKFSTYRCWMSASQQRPAYSELNNLQHAPPVHVISETKNLQLLRKIFSLEGDGRNIANLFNGDVRRQIAPPATEYVAAFKREIEAVLDFLSLNNDVISRLLISNVEEIIPLQAADPITYPLRSNGSGLSVQNYRGGIFLSIAKPSTVARFENALNMVHELGHQCLNVYLNADPVVHPDDYQKELFSIVRKTDRPAVLSFHALMASAFMMYFCREAGPSLRKMVDEEYLEERCLNLHRDVAEGVRLCGSLKLTTLGHQLLFEINQLVQTPAAVIRDLAYG